MTLEKLLNILCEKGWKPFWDENVKEIKIYSDMDMECIYWKNKSDFYYFSPREITSKESGLWQFVCENGMVVRKRQWTNRLWWEPEKCFDYKDYEYRIIESSLKDESELEKFLLENIKVEDRKKEFEELVDRNIDVAKRLADK